MAPQGVRVVMRHAFNTRERVTVQWRVIAYLLGCAFSCDFREGSRSPRYAQIELPAIFSDKSCRGLGVERQASPNLSSFFVVSRLNTPAWKLEERPSGALARDRSKVGRAFRARQRVAHQPPSSRACTAPKAAASPPLPVAAGART